MSGRGMKRAASTRSIFHNRAMKYKYFISLLTMSLLITSLIVIFTAVSLLKWYRLPFLRSWHSYFEMVPYLILAVGTFNFLVSFFGFFVSPLGSRCCLILLALLLSMACVAQIGSIFVTQKLTNIVQDENKGANKFLPELFKYDESKNDRLKHDWDDIQSMFHCCGVVSYKDWFNPREFKYDVPTSCCADKKPTKNCGDDVGNLEDPEEKVYVNGCIEMMIEWLDKDVVPIIKIYSAVGAIVAVFEIIGISLATAYAAQINRKHLREKDNLINNAFKQPKQGFHRISISQTGQPTNHGIAQDPDSEVEV